MWRPRHPLPTADGRWEGLLRRLDNSPWIITEQKSDDESDMDWEDIRLLLEIGRSGSFTAAARLNLHQASISRRIAALESAAGTPLFRRRPRHGAALTEAGRELFIRALAVEEQITEFDLAVDGAAAAEDQSVTVGSSKDVATYLLAPLSAGARIGPVGLMLDRIPDLRLPPTSLISAGGDELADIDLIWSERGTAPASGLPNYRRRLATTGSGPSTRTPTAPGRTGCRRPSARSHAIRSHAYGLRAPVAGRRSSWTDVGWCRRPGTRPRWTGLPRWSG
jgi:molybdenum-dependent DNA-binding transcriptional regulator ModE